MQLTVQRVLQNVYKSVAFMQITVFGYNILIRSSTLQVLPNDAKIPSSSNFVNVHCRAGSKVQEERKG